jgi:hypothetical protein
MRPAGSGLSMPVLSHNLCSWLAPALKRLCYCPHEAFRMTPPLFSIVAASFYVGWLWHNRDARSGQTARNKVAAEKNVPEPATDQPTSRAGGISVPPQPLPGVTSVLPG